MLNAESKASAIAALKCKKISDAARVISLVESHNQKISQWMYKADFWKTLQHLDSTIAANIIRSLTEKGIAVLPWHDSFIVQEAFKPILLGTMLACWGQQFGAEFICNCKIEEK
jgi:hypothetical protein